MSTSPRLGFTELTAGQAVPETTVNEIDRYLEAFANGCHFKSRANNPAEPGSPADGDCYLLTGTPTGTHWAGQGGKIALYINTAWVFITAKEGFIAWVDDEDVVIAYNGATWAALGSASGSLLAANNLSDVASVTTSRTNLGVGTGDSPQFTAVNIGHASDTTVTRTGAGDIAVEGNAIYRAGGTDVALADGGTGVSLTDPNADRVMFWDDSAGSITWLTMGTGLTITGTTLDASAGSGYTDEQAQDAVGAMIDSSLTYVDATPLLQVNQANLKPTEHIQIACSDETTAITTGTAKVTFRMPYAFTLTDVRASVNTAPTGSTIIIDINESGTTILSTKLSIDASEKTSTTAASAAVISDASLADDAEITIDFDQVGSTIAGKGVKVILIGHRT